MERHICIGEIEALYTIIHEQSIRILANRSIEVKVSIQPDRNRQRGEDGWMGNTPRTEQSVQHQLDFLVSTIGPHATHIESPAPVERCRGWKRVGSRGASNTSPGSY